jgi:hypothetical protein
MPIDTNPAGLGARIPFGPAASTPAGFAWNFVWHPTEQKKYFWPACSVFNFAVARSTFIPHTGSMATLSPFIFSIFSARAVRRQIALGETASLLDTRRASLESQFKSELQQ